MDSSSPVVEYESTIVYSPSSPTIAHSPSPPTVAHTLSPPTVARSPSPPTTYPPSTLPLPLLVQEADHNQKELQAQEEIRQEFHWLAEMLIQNKKQGWGTAYRDFVDVMMLLRAVHMLGMVELGNNRISDGVFSASTGDFTLNLATFVDIINLGYTPSTWRNKLTMYFRLKSLYQYSQHTDRLVFQIPSQNIAWSIVSRWMENQDKALEVNWVTTRFGNTELRQLLRSMLQEAYKGKCAFCYFSFDGIDDTESSYIQKVEWST